MKLKCKVKVQLKYTYIRKNRISSSVKAHKIKKNLQKLIF